jgi:hypothetical protein
MKGVSVSPGEEPSVPFELKRSFRIVEWHHHGYIDDFDREKAILHVLIETDADRRWVWVTFSELMDHCRTNIPAMGEYLKKLRQQQPSFLPSEVAMLKQMRKDKLNLVGHIREYLCTMGNYATVGPIITDMP